MLGNSTYSLSEFYHSFGHDNTTIVALLMPSYTSSYRRASLALWLRMPMQPLRQHTLGSMYTPREER